jgi:hypothetical protein
VDVQGGGGLAERKFIGLHVKVSIDERPNFIPSLLSMRMPHDELYEVLHFGPAKRIAWFGPRTYNYVDFRFTGPIPGAGCHR